MNIVHSFQFVHVFFYMFRFFTLEDNLSIFRNCTKTWWTSSMFPSTKIVTFYVVAMWEFRKIHEEGNVGFNINWLVTSHYCIRVFLNNSFY